MSIAKYLYSKYRKDFIKFYHAEQLGKPSFKDMAKSFMDSNGKQYYNYPESVSLPMSRLSKLLEYTMWLNAGLTGAELLKFLDVIDQSVADGLTIGKNAAKIGFVTTEIRNRKGMIVHHELLANYIAVQNVREDEDPNTFNNEIQNQKVDQILKEIEQGNNYFFFQAPESRKLINSLHITQDELMTLFQESQTKEAATKEFLPLLQSQKA